MLVSEINNNSKNITFAAFNPKVKTKAPDTLVILQGEMSSQLNSIVGVFNNIHESLRKLGVQSSNEKAQKLLEDFKLKFNINEIFETRNDGISMFDEAGNKNLLISTHGHNSLRIREQNPKNGFIENSLFIKDRKLVKTDTRNEIPEKLEYLQQNEINMKEFQLGLQNKFNDLDFSLLKIRRELEKTEVQAEIKKVDPIVTQTVVSKNLLLQNQNTPVPQNKIQTPVQPKKKLLSYYEKMLMAQRAQRAVNPKSVKETTRQAVKKSTEKVKIVLPKAESKHSVRPPRIKPVLEQPPVVKEVKRRGRPPKYVLPQTEPAGTLKEQQPVIDSIWGNYIKYKEGFVNLGVPRRKKLHNAVGFETKQGNPSILMRNVGENRENLHLSFPTFNNKRGIKIQVLGKNDNVENVFYVIDGKMVKFNANKGIHSRQHQDRNILFYSQAEIDNSGVERYLAIVNDRMVFAVQELNNIKGATNARFFNKRINSSRKSFTSQIQKQLMDLQKELAKKLQTSPVDISKVAQQGLTDIQKNTIDAIEALKQKLIELIKPCH